MIKILTVEDDPLILKNLSELLKNEGFESQQAVSVNEAKEILSEKKFDLILLDILLPDGNGFSLFSMIKSITDTPVIFLTASADEFSVVTGLDMGADDYIEKPFRPRELISRIKTVLRRSGRTGSTVKIQDITVDMDKGTVFKGGNEVFLSALEYKLLLVFTGNPDTVLTRSKLLSEIWDWGGDFVNDNTLTVYIKRLREKIEDDAAQPKIILTVRGLGYKLGGSV
ncbi:MAG: response regulator transcription factor [Clostridia bacterium]|nr:response regulator transcription factor [Clostridia bacterium]